jgi:K+-sensing histidine kinase KdpD
MEATGGPAAKTEILYGAENAVFRGAQFMANARERMDFCYGKEAPSIVIEVDAYRNGYRDVRARGGKIRVITEITKDNIGYCKKLGGIADELRHRDGVKGGLVVSESEYMATTAELHKGEPLTQVIYSNSQVLVDQQQYIFDSMWSNAIPAEAKYAEIEHGEELQVTSTIAGAQELYERIFNAIRSAGEQVLVMSSDLGVFYRGQPGRNLVEALDEASSKSLDVRVLVPSTEDALAGQLTAASPRIKFGTMKEEMQEKITIVVADRARVVFGALKEKVDKEIGIYSSNKSIASTYSLIIESLWNQIEIYRKLQELDELKEEFVNIAAHELRTPVLPIILTAESLSDDVGADNAKIGIILRNAGRLNRLTNQILDISRLDSNTFKLKKESADIMTVVKDVVNNPFFKANSKVDVTVRSALDGKKVAIDKERVAQVLFNLLDNAVKFTTDGVATVSVSQDAGHVRIDVADTGKGIDESIKDRLFTKFATKSTAELKGTGLGLYLCKKIVEAHGGKIWAKNNDKAMGATFTFTLPIEEG